MTRSERRALRRDRAELEQLSRHPSPLARASALQGLVHLDALEQLDPRPALLLRLRLRLHGVDAG